MELLLALTYFGPPAAAVLIGLLSQRVIIIVIFNIISVMSAAVPHALILKNWFRTGQDDWMNFLRGLALTIAIMIGISFIIVGARMLIAFSIRKFRKN